MKKVQVLMSTFNGQEYIKEQIDSILNQKDVETSILIRDDGSKDETISIIKKIQKKYPDRIKLIIGNNVGYKRSFFYLMQKANDIFDFFAFADQDDVWLPKKIVHAINNLNSSYQEFKLYGSTVTITNKDLNISHKKNIDNYRYGLGSSLTRSRIAGCTMVFNNNLLNLVNRFSFDTTPDNIMPPHDVLLLNVAMAIDNSYVFVDKNSYILHRRSQDSITGGGNGIAKRIKSELALIFSFSNGETNLVKKIKTTIPNQISNENIKLINQILKAKTSFLNRIKLLLNKKLDCGIFLGNIEIKFKILLNRF